MKSETRCDGCGQPRPSETVALFRPDALGKLFVLCDLCRRAVAASMTPAFPMIHHVKMGAITATCGRQPHEVLGRVSEDSLRVTCADCHAALKTPLSRDVREAGREPCRWCDDTGKVTTVSEGEARCGCGAGTGRAPDSETGKCPYNASMNASDCPMCVHTGRAPAAPRSSGKLPDAVMDEALRLSSLHSLKQTLEEMEKMLTTFPDRLLLSSWVVHVRAAVDWLDSRSVPSEVGKLRRLLAALWEETTDGTRCWVDPEGALGGEHQVSEAVGMAVEAALTCRKCVQGWLKNESGGVSHFRCPDCRHLWEGR